MTNAVTLRYVPRQHGNCWICRDSLSDRHHRVVAHVDPSNPGRLIHPVHKRCLLDAYQINNIQRCWCSAQLDLQRLLRRRNPEPIPRPLLINLERLEEELIVVEHHVYIHAHPIPQMIELLLPILPSLMQSSQAFNEMHQNLTHTQDLDNESLDPITLFRVGVAVAMFTQFYFGSFHGRITMGKNFLTSSMALATATADMEEDLGLERTMSLLPIYLVSASVLLSSERGRDFCRQMCHIANKVFSYAKNDYILGAAIGLSARAVAANENVPLQQINATLLVAGSMIVYAIAKGIWPIHLVHRHPDRN